MRDMRRSQKAIGGEETFHILKNCDYGVLSTVDENGQPYGIPVNFSVFDNCIYFHCAVEGHKIDNFTNNPKVSFCVVGESSVLSTKFDTHYKSVIVFGVISEVFEEEKQKALEGLVLKYSGDFFEKGLQYIEAKKERTRVFKISIETITGKGQ